MRATSGRLRLDFQYLTEKRPILDTAGPGQYGPARLRGRLGEKPGFPLGFASVGNMSDGARGNGEQGSRPADDAALSARLRRLGERLDRVGARRSPRTDPASRPAADASA